MNDPARPREAAAARCSWRDSAREQIEDVGEEVPTIGTQSVAWIADRGMQSTLSQGFYGGADYLLVRPHLSEPNAFLFGQGSNGQVTAATNTFDFNYQSSPPQFSGYRSPVTGSGVQFTYWHFEENASSNFTASGQNSGFFPNLDIIWLLIGNNNNNNNNNNNGPDFGNSMTARCVCAMNVFDIDLFKPVALGTAAGCSPVRLAQDCRFQSVDIHDLLRQRQPYVLAVPDNAFTGAGPRLWGEARRKRCGAASCMCRAATESCRRA